MSGLSDTINPDALTLSDASAAIVAALSGKTRAKAKALMEDTIDVYGFDLAISRGDVVTYALSHHLLHA